MPLVKYETSTGTWPSNFESTFQIRTCGRSAGKVVSRTSISFWCPSGRRYALVGSIRVLAQENSRRLTPFLKVIERVSFTSVRSSEL